MNRLTNTLKSLFLSALNSTFPPVRLLFSETSIIIPPDGFGAVEENLAYNIYFKRNEISSADTIIDLGAHVGTFTIWTVINAKKGAKIIAVEPDKENYSTLLQNLDMYKQLIENREIRVIPINKAVWHRSGKVKLKPSTWSEAHQVSNSGTEEVEAITLDELLNQAKGTTLIKMDIEGAETKVLESSHRLDQVSAISVEAHSNEDTVREILLSRGFKVETHIYKIGADLLHYWVKAKPRPYTSLIAIYRLIASHIGKPTVTIIKAKRNS